MSIGEKPLRVLGGTTDPAEGQQYQPRQDPPAPPAGKLRSHLPEGALGPGPNMLMCLGGKGFNAVPERYPLSSLSST